MKLFDKKFVHFMWSDELEGKEGFVADDICELTNCVLGGDMHYTKTSKSLSPAFPFRDIKNNDWKFFYYDPNYEVKKAYAEGKQVQMLEKETWINCYDPVWIDSRRYRVKPKEPDSRRMTYRELAEWIAKGNGQVKIGGEIHAWLDYVVDTDDKEVGYKIRRWGSDEWIEATADIYNTDCRKG